MPQQAAGEKCGLVRVAVESWIARSRVALDVRFDRLGNDVTGPPFYLGKYPPDIFAKHADGDQLHAAKKENGVLILWHQ